METTETLPSARLGNIAGYGLYNHAMPEGAFTFRGHGGAIMGGLSEMAYLPDAGRGYARYHDVSVGLGNADDFDWQRSGAHIRAGAGLLLKKLLTGRPGTPENYLCNIAKNEGDYGSPRHRHNFDQIRVALDGDMRISPRQSVKEGQIGYFPEGTYYGPYDDAGRERVIEAVRRSLADLLEWFLAYDERTARMRHPHPSGVHNAGLSSRRYEGLERFGSSLGEGGRANNAVPRSTRLATAGQPDEGANSNWMCHARAQSFFNCPGLSINKMACAYQGSTSLRSKASTPILSCG